ncbi:hypothetical protein [Methanobacterium petrolearium]|uniref:hypothetical protein n=1 Tax=Methanobacterium petrolearium TaxID=710190 RepID=UPI001AE347AE|nr:hypothetical protein [Methanobacterium petrolearium]MBP1945201.1 beta-lactamase superfamily II metal-dependent hydrolase [Methanobacterium petrolearium]
MLKIHFLNVGHGDCCIVEFLDTGRTAIVDINRTSEIDKSSADELTAELSISKSLFEIYSQKAVLKDVGYNIDIQDPIKYLDDQSFDNIFRFISTHPHMDHLTGLNTLLSDKTVWNVWILKNNIEPDLNKLTSSQVVDWELYKSLRDSIEEKKELPPSFGLKKGIVETIGIKIILEFWLQMMI